MFAWRDCSWRTCQLLFVRKVFFSHPVGTSEKCGETGVILAIMISNLLSFTAFLHGVLVSYGAFVCVLLKDRPPLFATKVIHGIMVPSFFGISKVFVWKCVWPLYLSLSLSLFISPPSFSLWFHNTCHLMLFTQYSLLDQVYFCTLCLSIVHFKFTNKIHQLFTDYLLRLPYSELLETHLFRSRANRRLVFCVWVILFSSLFGCLDHFSGGLASHLSFLDSRCS